MKLKHKIQLGLLALTIILCAVIWIITHRHVLPSGTPDTILVEVTKVKLGTIPIEAQAVGTLVADKDVVITPEFGGQIRSIYFHDGDFVKQDTPLVKLDDKVTKSKTESTKAALFYSEANYKRMKLLSDKGIISKQAIESAEADVKQKQADAQENQVTLDKTKISAPFDGVLGKALVSRGDHVTSGQALVSLIDVQHLRVEYSVSENYFSQLKKDQEVKVKTNAYPEKIFTGKVAYISPAINKDDRTISLYAEINNEERLLTAGLFVNVIHSLGTQDAALLLPPQSLIATIDGQKVYKIVDGKAVSTPVTIGQRNADSVQIINGIDKDDIVVTAGQEKLKEGMPVTIKNINNEREL